MLVRKETLKKPIIISMMLSLLLQKAFGAGLEFYDIEDSIAKDEIIMFVKKKIIKVTEEREFRPEEPATRAEFLALSMKALNKPIDELLMTTDYADVPIAWMIKYVEKAKDFNIRGQDINGKKYFMPDNFITRAEAMAMLLNLSGKIPGEYARSSFADVTVPWEIRYIERAKELGMVKGQTIGGKLSFRPEDPITRAEAVKIISKLLPR